jgi:glycosyltransferase involved in cell wall biosynthesis
MNVGVWNARVGTRESGGTETFLREMIKRLVSHHEVTLYTGEGDLLAEVRQFDVDVVQVPYWPKEGRINAQLSSRTPLLPAEVETVSMAWHAWRNGTFDRIEHEEDVLSLHYYLDNLLLSRAVDVPTVFHFPGIRHPSVRWRAMARLAAPTRYLANSESTARRAREWLDIAVDGTVYPGVDYEQFHPGVEPAFERDSPVILYVGRLDEGKGLAELIDAHARLDAELYLVGAGTLTADLRERVRRLGTTDRVTFTGGIEHERLPGYYAAADVFCLPSHHESLGIVNIEAMATGVPVVSTRIDAIEEYLDDGENGLLVSPGDTDELAAALGRLIGDPALRDRLGQAGRRTAESYSWDRQAEELSRQYERTRR